MTFDYFWKKRRKEYPAEARYISLCHILEGSGETPKALKVIFLMYMRLDEDYDLGEEGEMIKYLIKISKDRQ